MQNTSRSPFFDNSGTQHIAQMAGSRFLSKIVRFISKRFRTSARKSSSYSRNPSNSVLRAGELSNNKMLLFNFEGAMLRSTSLFPYFMLVAFEAGGLLRSLILLLSYPLVWLVGEDQLGLKIMVFLSFFGIKEKTFRIGSAVLPKFFLEDVGCESFEAVMSCERKVAVSKMPRIMVEVFLKEYIGVETVAARDIKSFFGYFLGLMNEKEEKKSLIDELKQIKAAYNVIGIGSHNKHVDPEVFSHCKEAYFVSDAEKRNWHVLPRERYPKPLIFHDGRLAFRPTPASSLAMFMWLPLGLFTVLFRFAVGVLLPFKTSAPILAFSGTRTTVSTSLNSMVQNANQEIKTPKGMMYVCNHRTLLDPLYISYALDKQVSAVTYSLSRFNELISPVRTIPLTRNRDEDRKTMEKLLSLGNLVVCPEGTTCREPYLLRFSPLFAELTDDIAPVALDVQVSMFYGTTASGHKCLDPFFHFLNPNPSYSLKFLDALSKSQTCQAGGKSKIEVANHVQSEIAKVLGFVSTSLTRKDKYMILAGNEGIVRNSGGHTTS